MLLYISFLGYIIASYHADSWQETILQITVAGNEPTDFVLKTRSLALLFQEADNFLAMLIIWLSYFFIPSAFMILIPLWMVHDLYIQSTAPLPLARILLEQFAQAAMLLVWLQAVQNIALTGISIQTVAGQLVVRNRSGPAWTALCIAASCCLSLLCVLRKSHTLPGDDNGRRRASVDQYEALMSHEAEEPHLLGVRSPPPEAFARFPFRQLQHVDVTDDEISMTVLEEQPGTPRSRIPPLSAFSTPEPELLDEEDPAISSPKRISQWQRVVLFQLALISTFLWIPCMYIPIFTIHYRGLASILLQESQLSFFVWNLASPQQELTHDSRFYNNALLCVVVFLCLVLIPVSCTGLSVLVWLGEGSWSASSRRILYTLQPFLGAGLVLLASLLIAMSTLDLGDSAQFCKSLILEVECLHLTGELALGAWLYALHSLVLLMFVHCTLQWSWKS
jgi:hypothetical protein